MSENVFAEFDRQFVGARGSTRSSAGTAGPSDPVAAPSDLSPAHQLATSLETKATTAMDAGDYRTAESQWARALHLWQELEDRPGLTRVLRSLARMYRAWPRLHRALDMVFELECELRREPCDPAGLAGALTEIGTTMLEANRPDSAADYLKRAVTAYEQLPEPAPIDHAGALVWWGKALLTQGARTAARRRFHTALALLVDIDDTLADQVRGLLALT